MNEPEQTHAGLRRLSVLAVALVIVVYPFGRFACLTGNFHVVDALLIFSFALLMIIPSTCANILQIYRSGYGILAYSLICCLLFSTMFSGDISNSLLGVAQVAVVYLVLIPAIGVCVAHLREPEKFVGRLLAGYGALYIVGIVLLSQGTDILVQNSGNNRYYPVWGDPVVYRQLLTIVAFALSAYAFRQIRLTTALAWLCMVVVMQIGVASRGCILAMLATVIVTLWTTVCRGKCGTALITGTIAVAGILAVAGQYTGYASPDFLSLKLSSRYSSKGTGDRERTRMAHVAVDGLGDPVTALVGVGLASSERPEKAVHNPVLQYAFEAGLPAGVLLFCLMAYPLVAFRGIDSRQVQMGWLIYFALFVYAQIAPLSVNRAVHICEGLALGLMWRGSLRASSSE